MERRKYSASAAITDYIQAALKKWGGPTGFGRALKEEFDRAKPGSHQRIRIMDMMMQWLKIENDLRPRSGNYDDMNDDEIRAELHRILADEDADE